MAPPTLFVAGSLRDPEGNLDRQKELDNIIPIDYCETWFKNRINKKGVHNRVLVLKSGTASAKSTGFIAEINKRVVSKSPHGKRGMIVTQPRILTAIKNVSQIVSVYKELKIGQDIGWSTQFDKMKPKRFGILSATVGTLTAQMSLLSDEDIINQYQVIAIDETHERNLQTDSVILMLYNFLRRNANDPRCPFVVFMSATFEPDTFIKYFANADPEVTLLNNFIHVVGQSVGYDIYWPEKIDPSRYLWDLAAEQVDIICRENPDDQEESCDILIFMPGAQEIEKTELSLKPIVKKLFDDGFGACYIMPISGKAIEKVTQETVDLDKPNNILKIKNPGSAGSASEPQMVTPRRKIVISTIVAETGLTLDQLKYVIETGFHRSTVFNPNFCIDTLLSESVPKSRVTQRFGRVGRKTRGSVYPLYTKETYDSFIEQQFPEIIVNDFSEILLSVLMEQIKDSSGNVEESRNIKMSDINMLTNPASAMSSMAYEAAYKLGLVSPTDDDDCIRLTKIGAVSSKLSVRLTNARLLASGHVFGYSVYDLVNLVSALEIASGRDFEKIKFDEIYEKVYGTDGRLLRALVSDDFIDIIVLMHFIVKQFDNGIPNFDEFCVTNKLPQKIIVDILVRRDQLMSNMLTLGYNITKSPSICNIDGSFDTESLTRLKYCLHDSFKTNIIELSDDGRYKHKGINVSVPHFRRSEIKALTGADQVIFPKYLVFDTLTGVIQGGRMIVTAYHVSTMSGYCYLDMH